MFVVSSQGDYVIVDPIEEGEKVKAEISFILYKDHIQYLQKQQLWWVGTENKQTNTWHSQRFVVVFFRQETKAYCDFASSPSRPDGFKEEPPAQGKTNKQQDKEEETEEKDEGEDISDSEDDESDLFVNTNRCNYQYSESEEEDSEAEDEHEEERTGNGS